MATGKEVVEYYGVTVEQAITFIMANVENPEVIYNVVWDAGITLQHLSDITSYSIDAIRQYFTSSGLDAKELDNVRILFNSDLGDLASKVVFNSHSGILSTASLSGRVESLVDPIDYKYFFGSVFPYQEADNFYSPDELGVAHLGKINATEDDIESIIYGTLINLYTAIDQNELNQLKSFSHNDSNISDYRAMLADALSDSATRSEQDLADLVVNETVALIDEYWNGDIDVVGSLDLSILGLAGI